MAQLNISIEITANTKLSAPEMYSAYAGREPVKEVFITWLPTDTFSVILTKCEEIKRMGYSPVPHIVAKKVMDSKHAYYMANQLSDLVDKVLIIGGGTPEVEGEFSTVDELVATGAFDIFKIGVAGFPEGNNTLSYEQSLSILKAKKRYASFVVTQWSLNETAIKRFLDDSPLPVYLGVPNGCSLNQLLNFAKICGIANSVKGILANPKNLLKFALGFKPTSIINSIKGHKNLESIHVYTFGNTTIKL